MTEALLTIPEFCRTAAIGRTYAYQLLKAGAVPAVKVGRRTYVRRSDLEAWLAALPSYASKATSNG